MTNLHSMAYSKEVSSYSSKRMRLFCFPYAGGNAISIFRGWSEELPGSIEVFPVQLPGRGSRVKEPPIHRLEELIPIVASEIHPYLNIPFAFFGHSMGGLISFELVRYLKRQYQVSPVYLFVSSYPAPQLPRTGTDLHQLPDNILIEKLRSLKGIPPGILREPNLIELILPVLRADLAVCETYVYSDDKPVECPILVFGGLNDPIIDHNTLDQWRHLTQAAFNIRKFNGDHFFLDIAQTLILDEIAGKLITFFECR